MIGCATPFSASPSPDPQSPPASITKASKHPSAPRTANEDWEATQKAAAAKAAAADEVQRQKASAALGTAETALGPPNQTAGAAERRDRPQQPDAGGFAGGERFQHQAARRRACRHIGQPGHGEPGHQRRQGGARAHRGAGGHDLLRRRLRGHGLVRKLGPERFGGGDQPRQRPAQRHTKTLGITQAIQPVQYAQGSNIAGTIASHWATSPAALFRRRRRPSLKSAFGS